ncbi:hypothetical protein PAXY110619_29765 [Paenibacillus xylanexedens]|uniref:Uncharacterized protein n=1 Tax=Paenibacillus xylanexedens TaxID=528191 RepID=A0ABS4RRS5_PAEXY|nr:hypothetical protein [Paenibacillus xylanexedens]
MKEVITASDLMEQLITMNKENSVCQVRIPGKGMYVIVLQDDYSTVPSSDQIRMEQASPQWRCLFALLLRLQTRSSVELH